MKDLPKLASANKKTMAFLIDLISIFLLFILCLSFFDMPKVFLQTSPLKQYLLMGLYFYFFLNIVPKTIFSQSLGSFILGLKVVGPAKYERLPMTLIFAHCFFFASKSQVIVVEIR